MKPSILITHHGQPVALVNARHTTLLPAAALLRPGDPQLKTIIHKTYYAQLVAYGKHPGPYRDRDAEEFAHAALIDRDVLTRHLPETDWQVTDRLDIAAEQLAIVRADRADPSRRMR